jgi:glycosyltransferase involved in cell wall biosynthesis
MIDVVIPAYIPNEVHFHYLIEALSSLKEQTYKDFTARIIVNGGLDVSDRLPKDDRFDVIKMEGKQSGAKARNHGIRLGNSKYVAQLDADDLYLPEKLQKQFEFMENHEDYSLVATSNLVLRGGVLRKSCNDPRAYGTHDQINSVINDVNPICCGSVMFRRSDVFDCGFFYNEKYTPGEYWPTYGKPMNEDWDLWIRCIESNKRICVLPEELYIWREGSSVAR